MDQSNLLENMVEFNNKIRPKKRESITALYKSRELILNAFRSGTFPIKVTKGKGLKLLTPKQMLQRLPIALGQVKSGNT